MDHSKTKLYFLSLLPGTILIIGVLLSQDRIRVNTYVRLAFHISILTIWHVSILISFLAKNTDGNFDRNTKICQIINYLLFIISFLAILINEMIFKDHEFFIVLVILSIIISTILSLLYLRKFFRRI